MQRLIPSTPLAGLLASLMAVGTIGSAHASPGINIEARMFMRDTGRPADDDLLARGDHPRINVLDYGVLADEVIVVVSVPDGMGTKLTVTVKQGKTTTKRAWQVNVGTGYGIERGHYPILVSTDDCNAMTITARIGRSTTTRTLDFNCDE
jgi:hypothetical protein